MFSTTQQSPLTHLGRRAAFAATLAVGVAGFGLGLSTSDVQAQNLQGTVEVDGSSTVAPITEAARDKFREQHSGVNVNVGISGTGGGFKRFVKGETDISDASRPIKPSEFQAARENGIEFLELPVAMDGLSIVVNPSNDWADTMTVDQLKAIFLEGGANKWSDIDSRAGPTRRSRFTPPVPTRARSTTSTKSSLTVT